MLASFVLSLREGLEAALIIGIVWGALQKFNRDDLKPVVWRGVISAVLVSLAGAVILNLLGASFEGKAEEIFEGVAMISAAFILTWMIFWMRHQASSLRTNIETDVKQAMMAGRKAIFALVFLAIIREGLELVLFLTATGIDSGGVQTVVGAVAGLLVSALLGYLLFATTYRLNLKQFFLVTNILLILFAAGLVAHGVHEFNEAGIIPYGIEHVWDTNFIIDENSTFGELLTALFGYNANPSLTEVLAYLSYFAFLFILFRWNFKLILTSAGPKNELTSS